MANLKQIIIENAKNLTSIKMPLVVYTILNPLLLEMLIFKNLSDLGHLQNLQYFELKDCMKLTNLKRI